MMKLAKNLCFNAWIKGSLEKLAYSTIETHSSAVGVTISVSLLKLWEFIAAYQSYVAIDVKRGRFKESRNDGVMKLASEQKTKRTMLT